MHEVEDSKYFHIWKYSEIKKKNQTLDVQEQSRNIRKLGASGERTELGGTKTEVGAVCLTDLYLKDV